VYTLELIEDKLIYRRSDRNRLDESIATIVCIRLPSGLTPSSALQKGLDCLSFLRSALLTCPSPTPILTESLTWPFSCPIFLRHIDARGRFSQSERLHSGRELEVDGPNLFVPHQSWSIF